MYIDWQEQLLIVTRGFSGSGKTTWAKQMELEHGEGLKGPPVIRINRDMIRLELGFKYDPKRENEITRIQNARIRKALREGYTVIADDTHLNPKYMPARQEMAEEAEVPLIVNDDFMQVSVEECIKRDINREISVGKDVIEQQYYRWWDLQEKPVNEGPRHAVVCDIDGTLAIIPDGKNPYKRDWSQDTLNSPVKSILQGQRLMDRAIVLTSGRSVEAHDATVQWLLRHDVPFDLLLMRPIEHGPKKKDFLIKRDMYMNSIRGYFHVDFVLDDRPSVVRRWRAELGIPCFQVAANIEF